jgi:hypothetical protein
MVLFYLGGTWLTRVTPDKEDVLLRSACVGRSSLAGVVERCRPAVPRITDLPGDL